MKVLITGSNGFIGKNLSLHLSSCGHKIIEYEYQNDKFPNVASCDWVIHCGAISSTTETDVEKILKLNYEFTIKLLQLCVKKEVNFQYASSASVYGSRNNFKETSKKFPQSPYAWSKYLIDRFIFEKNWNKKKYNIQIQGFRYFNVYGPHEEHKKDQASPITKFTIQAKKTGIIKIFENSENYKRDFICVGDVCKIHEKMLKKKVSPVLSTISGAK